MLGIPCVLLRRATERPDGLGTSVLLGDLDREAIYAFAREHARSGRKPALRDDHSPSALIVERLGRFSAAAPAAAGSG